MKTVIYNVILNLVIVTISLLLIYSTSQLSSLKTVLFYLGSCLLLPIVGLLINSMMQKKLDLILSNLYISILTAIFSIIPIEIFKHTSKLREAKNSINGNKIGNSNSSITLDVDLDFNIGSYVIAALIWIFIGTILGSIFKYRKKRK
ncbi:hypothetical protein [Staphylococcus hominis]|uniref:hypothetical protein n=1 Tax=Staphylococcus hominis TaxID=1290 RepID=UPI001F5613DA|nr:hypothetical protein [Staphylococcus hominis]MCI2848416.1 hypothetical protein [Staphylococcus hominis]MCI2850619.1 hypothetical protein [Staphylococcus hominis]MCI2857174.1 hypothetical protein [Staphylococcus hominis]